MNRYTDMPLYGYAMQAFIYATVTIIILIKKGDKFFLGYKKYINTMLAAGPFALYAMGTFYLLNYFIDIEYNQGMEIIKIIIIISVAWFFGGYLWLIVDKIRKKV